MTFDPTPPTTAMDVLEGARAALALCAMAADPSRPPPRAEVDRLLATPSLLAGCVSLVSMLTQRVADLSQLDRLDVLSEIEAALDRPPFNQLGATPPVRRY